jgi:hypothetical protein
MGGPPPPSLPLNNLPYSIYLVLCMSSDVREVTAFCHRITFQDGLKGRLVKKKKYWL